jgi:hypothetical protein
MRKENGSDHARELSCQGNLIATFKHFAVFIKLRQKSSILENKRGKTHKVNKPGIE